MSESKLHLFDAKTAQEKAEVTQAGLDVHFPADVAGWTDVLDCREEPYTEQSIAENCAYAKRVNKKYILVEPQQVAQETPPVDEA